MRLVLRAAGALLAAVMINPAVAEPDSTGRWLMDQPLTLWDMGMMRATDSAQSASERVEIETSKNPLAGPFAWASYDWNNNEIDITLSIFDYSGDITHEKCNESYVRKLTGR